MSTLFLILQGIFIGILAVAPISALSVYFTHKAVAKGKNEALLAGLGIAAADFIYSALGAFIVSFIVAVLDDHWQLVSFIASLGLLYMASVIRHPRKLKIEDTSSKPTFLRFFLLELSNPTMIVSFAAIVASIAIESSWLLAACMALGSFIWWFCLTLVVSKTKRVFHPQTIKNLNTFVAFVLICVALVDIVLIFV